MAQVKSSQINIVIEPAFLELVKQHFPNTSEYIRRLIMKDLIERDLITPELVKKVYLG